MARLLRRLLLLAAAAVAASGVVTAAGVGWAQQGEPGMLQVLRLDDGTTIQVEEFRGPSRAAALPYLFTNCAVEVSCPGLKEFSVFTGRSMEEVRAAYGRGERAWCGLAHRLSDSPNCTVALSPHGSTYVAVAKPRAWLGAGEGSACTLERREALSTPRLLAALLGAFMFWYAPVLAESTPFRLTGGTLGFVALSSIILMLFLYRRVPHKGKLFAGTAIFGSSFLAATRWLFGVWLPSLHQVLSHPVALGYLALSGLTGLALTYYYNNSENRKVNTMLRVGLQLAGLGAVYLSSTMHEASAALCAVLLGAKAAGFLRQQGSWGSALVSAKRGVQQLAADSEEVAVAGGRGAAGQPAAPPATEGAAAQQLQQRTPLAAVAAVPQAPAVSPLVQRGLILNEETGHIIGIGKATYNRLVESGYVVDQSAGTITPPPPSPGSPTRARRASGGRRRRS